MRAEYGRRWYIRAMAPTLGRAFVRSPTPSPSPTPTQASLPTRPAVLMVTSMLTGCGRVGSAWQVINAVNFAVFEAIVAQVETALG